MALLKSTSIGLSVVILVSDQFVKQYSICENIIVCKYSLAALRLRNGLICLKFCRLNLTLFATLFMWHLNVKVESNVSPRYLNSFTIFNSSLLRNTLDCITFVFCYENTMQTVLLVFK